MTLARLLVAAVLLCLCALSAYPLLKPDPIQVTASADLGNPAAQTAEEAASAAADTGTAEKNAAGKLKPVRPTDGANVERQVLDDGTVVTKFTPRDRSKDGPLVIDATAQGPQDIRSAAFPDEALVEETPDGMLPVVAADGTRPMDRYARPWSGARGTRIAIVVGGLALSQTGTQRALQLLPEEVTVAFAANGNSLSRWMPEARRRGHEVLLQVPMEPFDYPENDPGPLTLIHTNGAKQNIALLHRSMGKMTNYTGVMNYLGGRLLSDPDALEPVIREIGQRGLLFLDDGTSAQSLSATYAKAFSTPHAFADVVLDSQVSKPAILKKLDDLERIALRRGTAIGVASAFDESVDAITEWVEEAGRRGIEIVGVSVLADVPN